MSHVTEWLPLCAHFSSAGCFIVFVTRAKSFFPVPVCFIFVLLHVLPAFPGDVCRFISLFLAFHQGGHSAHCRISRREETQRPSLSSPWPRGLIFKGASCAMSPYDNKKHYECLRTAFSSIPVSENLWKVVHGVIGHTFYDYYYWLQ